MARIGEMLGWNENPLYKTLGANRNAITNFGAGLASGGWGGAAQGLANGASIDDYRAEQSAEKATQAAQLQSTADWLNSQGYTDLVPLVEAGQGGAAMTEAFKRMQPGYGQGERVSPIEINGQLVNPLDGSILGDYRDPNAARGDAPSGYQWTPEGDLAAIPGGPANRPAAVGWNSTTQKELFEAEDAVNAGGYVLTALDRAIALSPQAREKAGAGVMADVGTWIPDVGFGGDDATDNATIAYKNTVNELALNQLKTIFGAAPTEGERKILLDIQGSVDQPRAVREKILADARVAAERRIAEAQAKAAGLRSGEYFSPGYGGQQQPNGPRTTASGVTFSVDQQ